MTHLQSFSIDFMNKIGFGDEVKNEVRRICDKLDNTPDFANGFDDITERYFQNVSGDLEAFGKEMAKLAEEYGENGDTLYLVFLITSMPRLKAKYDETGIDEQIFYDTMADILYKQRECLDCEGTIGVFVYGWYKGFFELDRFAYGRFQYEVRSLIDDGFDFACGKHMNKGDTYINIHIPSSGEPLSDEVRFDSYRKAYKKFKHLFPDGNVIFATSSWLLFPKHREFLPERLNIRRFMDDFEIVSSDESDEFGNDWRIFGKYTNLPLDEWPTDTTLRKAYVDWLKAGNKTGSAFGMFVFDGEKILR